MSKTDMAKAVFLDRDGTINKEIHHLHKRDQLRLLPGVKKAIKNLNQAGFLVIVVTNQSVIARGLATKREEIDYIHSILIKRLKAGGAKIDAIYYCPHHPEGKIEEYKTRCRCRKPGLGMLKQAARRFNIDLSQSFMVGDMTTDIFMGQKAGLRTVLLDTGHGGKDGRYRIKPDYLAKNLEQAVEVIKKTLYYL